VAAIDSYDDHLPEGIPNWNTFQAQFQASADSLRALNVTRTEESRAKAFEILAEAQKQINDLDAAFRVSLFLKFCFDSSSRLASPCSPPHWTMILTPLLDKLTIMYSLLPMKTARETVLTLCLSLCLSLSLSCLSIGELIFPWWIREARSL
jgi:hypothetical protein